MLYSRCKYKQKKEEAQVKKLVITGRGKGWVNVRFALDRQWVDRKERLEKKIERGITYEELMKRGIEAGESMVSDEQ